MKSILSNILIIFPFFVFGQNTIMAEYLHTSETSNAKMSKRIVLYASNEKAKQVHFKSQLNEENEYGASLKEDGSISIIEKPSDFNNVWYYKASTKDIVKSVVNSNTNYIVYDTGLDYNWEITDEVDSVGNYQVIKATTYFRGRALIAWFAPAIPISFGPWKINGLPGLILKMYDEDRKFTWTVTKLNLNAELTEDSLEPQISDEAKEMTYQEGLNMSRKAYDEKQKRINTKLGGRGGNFRTVRHRDQDLERKYEWEEN